MRGLPIFQQPCGLQYVRRLVMYWTPIFQQPLGSGHAQRRVMRLIAHGSSNPVLGSCVSTCAGRPWFQQPPWSLVMSPLAGRLHVFQRNLRVLGHVISQRCRIARDLAQPAGPTASLVMRSGRFIFQCNPGSWVMRRHASDAHGSSNL
jgi:hypothetical protein